MVQFGSQEFYFSAVSIFGLPQVSKNKEEAKSEFYLADLRGYA